MPDEKKGEISIKASDRKAAAKVRSTHFQPFFILSLISSE